MNLFTELDVISTSISFVVGASPHVIIMFTELNNLRSNSCHASSFTFQR